MQKWYKNIRGEEYTFNSEYYYAVMLKDNGNIIIKKGRIKSFVVREDGVYLIGGATRVLPINDVYPSEIKCQEVIDKWQKEILEKELKSEIGL
jgi:hypothetical protein